MNMSLLKINGERLLCGVCVFYIALTCFSILLNIYAIVMYRVPLPSFDVVDYHEFLADAAEGNIRWSDLWVPHNDVHLVALPKLVWALDMWLGHGSGCFTIGVSLLAIIITVLLMIRIIYSLPGVSLFERRALSLLFSLVMTSTILLNSTVNPIDIQWSMLGLGLVLQACGIQFFLLGCLRVQAWLCLGIGSLIAYLCSAPISIMFFSGLTAAISVSKYRVFFNRKCFYWVLLLVLLAIFWELLALHFHMQLLFVILLSPLIKSADQSQKIMEYLYVNPEYYIKMFYDLYVFMASFVCIPLGQGLAPMWLLASIFILWMVLICKSFTTWSPWYIGIIYLFVFCFLLGAAAGVFRQGTGYDFRHANIGFILLFSSLVLIYQQWRSTCRQILLSGFLVLYGCCFFYVAVAESGEWAAWGRESLRRFQIGSAVDVNAPQKFGYVWKFDGSSPDSTEIRHSKEIFRRLGMGVYGTDAYKVFAGQIPLPATEVSCLYRVIQIQPVNSDSSAYFVQGQSKTTDGKEMNHVVFMGSNGALLGYGLAEMPSHNFWNQMMSEWLWGGYLLLDKGSVGTIRVIAYDSARRCQPWPVSLSGIR